MAQTDEFAHGSYGDDWGVTFYGPPNDGFWEDYLAVSKRFVQPLFNAVLDRFVNQGGAAKAPRLVTEWNEISGWADQTEKQEVNAEDAKELIAAISDVVIADLAEHCAGCTPDECVRCASVICQFLQSHIDRGVAVYIQND